MVFTLSTQGFVEHDVGGKPRAVREVSIVFFQSPWHVTLMLHRQTQHKLAALAKEDSDEIDRMLKEDPRMQLVLDKFMV